MQDGRSARGTADDLNPQLCAPVQQLVAQVLVETQGEGGVPPAVDPQDRLVQAELNRVVQQRGVDSQVLRGAGVGASEKQEAGGVYPSSPSPASSSRNRSYSSGDRRPSNSAGSDGSITSSQPSP